MSIPPEQHETAAFLQRLAGRAPVETHISLVFVGTDTVWKLKKAVHLPFVDFTRIEDRQRFVQRELAINAPAAPGIYRDVVPVRRRSDDSLTLDNDPALPAVDWVLRMAPVPATDFLDVMAQTNRLDARLLDAVADAVAAYHTALPPVRNVLPPMRRIAEGNVRSALAAGMAEDAVEAWQTDMLAAIESRADFLTERAATGFVRRAHGDLHLGNLCLWQGRPVLFDALEFDETLATIDLAYDFAFLLMDLDNLVDRASANRVLNRYVARTGDVGLVAGLPIFLSMRAMVRAHVVASTHHDEAAAAYLKRAAEYLRPPPPVAVAIGGLPGSGKSTLARALAPTLGTAPGALVLRSDEIRKRRFGVAPEQRLPQIAYAETASRAVFAEMADTMLHALSAGHAVIADAMFIDRGQRGMIADAAARAGVDLLGLWLDVPLPALEARVAGRTGDASDATVAVLRAAAAGNPGAGDWTVIDANDADNARDLAMTILRHHVVPRGNRKAESR